MGVTWTFEIISWLLGGPGYLWYLTDILNVLRGLFIFLILCVKRNVYTGLAKKLRRSRLPGASSRPRASSTNSRRHSKSSITTEHVALSRLNLAGNCQARIVEEEEGVRGEERGEPPPLAHAPAEAECSGRGEWGERRDSERGKGGVSGRRGERIETNKILKSSNLRKPSFYFISFKVGPM